MDKNIFEVAYMRFFHQYHGETQIIHNQKLNFEPHLHIEVEIIAIFSGRAKVTVNNKTFTAQDGDFIVVFPNTIHSYTAETPVDVGKFIFNPDFVSEMGYIFKTKFPQNPVISKKDAESLRLELTAREIIEQYNNGSSLVKKAYISLLTAKLLELCPLEDKNNYEHNTVSEVFNFCQKNFRSNITQKSVSDALHISESHLSHIFCSKVKMNFRSYINILRINEACRLMLESDKNIIDISGECGFSCVRTFNRVFIRNVGLSPTQYRKNIADKNADNFLSDKFFVG